MRKHFGIRNLDRYFQKFGGGDSYPNETGENLTARLEAFLSVHHYGYHSADDRPSPCTRFPRGSLPSCDMQVRID